MNHQIGPVCINMNRVLGDVFSILVSYVLVCLAFSSGLVFVKNLDVHTESGHTPYIEDFKHVFVCLIWKVLSPGPLDEEREECATISNFDGTKGHVVTALFVTFQILSIIILLNFLIAIMNSTIQRYQDRKQLYWKFSTTSIWMDFFSEHMEVPSPLCIGRAIWSSIFKPLLRIGHWCRYRGKQKVDQNDQDNLNTTHQGSQNHLKLKQDLIQRYIQKV